VAISKKMLDFEKSSSWIRKMFEEGTRLKAQYGTDNVCDFSLGNPDLPPPPEFHATITKMVAEESQGIHGYMPNSGYPQVRDAVAKQISLEQDIALSREELLMTCGAAGGLNVIMKALLDPGDEVIILAPFFVEYNFYVDNHNGVSKVVSTASDFSLDLDAIEQALSAKTKAIIINSPNNPSGQIYAAEELKRLGEILDNAANTIYLISDEPYRKIVYDKYQVPSIFRVYKNSIVVSSYSKDLSLAGERIGYIAVHPDIADKDSLLCAMTLANRILGFVNAPGLMQRVVGQLQGVVVDCAIYAKRRDLFCEILADAGYEFMPPKGAFYLFPKSPIPDDAAFIRSLLEQKILAVPGRGFGMPGYFRLAFCVEDSVIERSARGFKKAMAAVTVK
jgi:aspartate aminotransferase